MSTPVPRGSARDELGPARNAVRVKLLQRWAEGRLKRKSARARTHAQAFAQKQGLERYTLRFLFDGSCINEDDTALSLELEDDDMIDAFLHGCVHFDFKIKKKTRMAKVMDVSAHARVARQCAL